MKIATKIAACGLAAALLLTGCGKNGSQASAAVTEAQKQETVLTVDGVSYTGQDYAAAYLYNKGNLETMLAQYGVTADDMMKNDADKVSYHDQITEMAVEQLEYLAVCRNKLTEAGLTLDEAALDEELASQEAQVGGADALDAYLDKAGITREQYRAFASLNVMVDQLRKDYLEKNADTVRAYFDENYLRSKHVLIKTVDDNNAALENQDELEAKAREVADKAKAGSDFDALIAEYNEDPGMESNPDGYVFAEGTMVDEFYEGTKALAVNGISDPVKSSYGWHIIQRLPLRDADYTANQAGVVSLLFAKEADAWVKAAKVEKSDSFDAIRMDNAAGYVK